jgi:hypothetical protein
VSGIAGAGDVYSWSSRLISVCVCRRDAQCDDRLGMDVGVKTEGENMIKR